MMSKEKSFGCVLISVVSAVLALGIGACVLGAEAAAPSGPSASGEGSGIAAGAATPDDYIIKVDDILTIDGNQHYRFFDPRRFYRVASDGTIKLIFNQRVKAAGLTKRKLEDTLEKIYDPKYFKDLTIIVEVASKTYNIVGEVRNPGIKNLVAGTNIITAIASAGGFTQYAKESKVIVIRNEGGKDVRYEIDVKDVLGGRAEQDFAIKPNDNIWVPPKGLF